MSKVNWDEIPKDRNDEECLNCHIGHWTGNLGMRRLNDDFIQEAMTCKECGNIVITIYEEYNVSCPTCNDGWIKRSWLKNIEDEKLEIKKDLLREIIIELIDCDDLNMQWNKLAFLEFLQNYNIGEK